MVSLSRIDVIEEYISSLIQNKQENEFVDFKQFYYHEDKKYDLIKDIVSFSNEVTSVDKYIVFGIINGSWEPVGIDLFTIPDVSVINDLLHTYVEPFIYVEIGQMKYNGKNLGYIKIPVDRADRPYVIKKEYSKHGKTYLRCGEIYVRKNANNFIATRRDLDHIYRNNGAFKISVFDSTIDIGFVQIRNERKSFVQVRTILANNTRHSINICGGSVIFLRQEIRRSMNVSTAKTELVNSQMLHQGLVLFLFPFFLAWSCKRAYIFQFLQKAQSFC